MRKKYLPSTVTVYITLRKHYFAIQEKCLFRLASSLESSV
jgi:hypothetical protein